MHIAQKKITRTAIFYSNQCLFLYRLKILVTQNRFAMKKILTLLFSLFLISSLSFAQYDPISRQTTFFHPVSSNGDVQKDLNFPSSLIASPFPSLNYFLTEKSPGPGLKAMQSPNNYSSYRGGGDENEAFPRGTVVVNLGIGVGNLYWGSGYGSALAVSPTLDIDVAATDKLGIGNIGVGGTASYSYTKYNYAGSRTVTFSGVLVGLRGSYHFILNSGALSSKFDPYAGVMLGYIFGSGPNNPDLYGVGPKGSAFQPGVFAGAHYYFVQHFGVFAELGYNGFSIFTFGITLKTK
jgi:hypothetical protein